MQLTLCWLTTPQHKACTVVWLIYPVSFWLRKLTFCLLVMSTAYSFLVRGTTLCLFPLLSSGFLVWNPCSYCACCHSFWIHTLKASWKAIRKTTCREPCFGIDKWTLFHSYLLWGLLLTTLFWSSCSFNSSLGYWCLWIVWVIHFHPK